MIEDIMRERLTREHIEKLDMPELVDEIHALEDQTTSLESERDRLRDALRWYECHVRDCNRKGKEGDAARNALAQDMGERARAALQEAGNE